MAVIMETLTRRSIIELKALIWDISIFWNCIITKIYYRIESSLDIDEDDRHHKKSWRSIIELKGNWAISVSVSLALNRRSIIELKVDKTCCWNDYSEDA